MELFTHGGKCCGIKTIFSVGYDPENAIENAIENAKRYPVDHRGAYQWFKGKAPTETSVQRLKRFVEQVRVDRPGHIIEVVTATICDQTKKWRPHLEALGFKEVTKAKNSNSLQIVSIWHCIVKDGILVDAPVAPVKEEKIKAKKEAIV